MIEENIFKEKGERTQEAGNLPGVGQKSAVSSFVMLTSP